MNLKKNFRFEKEGRKLEGIRKSMESRFLKATDVAEILQVSETTAYRIVKKLNNELKQQGKIVVAGKISRKYFEEKVYL